MIAAETMPAVIEDVRGYGTAVVERLQLALEKNAPAQPDPAHPHLFVVEMAGESFYVAPLPTGKILLLAHWRNPSD